MLEPDFIENNHLYHLIYDNLDRIIMIHQYFQGLD